MYKAVIGLEVHCELDTKSKNFCSSPNTFSETPNINVGCVDLGLPGILPVVNKEAVRKSLLTAMALNCDNPDEVLFDRKNYFYPDLPKGYQITQVTKPMGKNGYLDIIVNDKKVRVELEQLHLEEDTASLEHCSKYSLIDYNRSGIPLMEIVTKPCIPNSDVAVRFLEELRDVFLFLGVSEAKSNYGQMRCDVNVSVMKVDAKELGTKVEMKNINAFSSVRDAIEYETKRQIELLESGGKVIQETRRIGEDGKTYSMREKVDAVDYKYFIEPNMVPVKLSDEYYEELRKSLPLLKLERYEKYLNEYSLSEYDSEVLSSKRDISDYFDEVLSYGSDLGLTVNFVTSSILSTINKLEININELFITPKMLSGVIDKVSSGDMSLDHGKKILYKAIDEGIDPNEIIKKENLKQINDRDTLVKLFEKVKLDNMDRVNQYLDDGNTSVYNFFVGKMMKESNRCANPNISLDIIKEELEKMRNEK